jgi:phosphoglycerate dehydrogenase-like enzyme
MKNKVNILVTFKMSEDAQARIMGISSRISLRVFPVKSADEISQEDWQSAHVLFTQDILPDPALVPNLRWVQFRFAGVDPFLDHPLVLSKNVSATTMSGAITSQIAEYVLMAILAMGQRLQEMFRNQREKQWLTGKEKWDTFVPTELRDSTVGIVGYGSIGRQVARLLQPFKPTILAVKKDVFHPEDSGYIPDGMGDPHGDFFSRLYPIEALESVLEKSDFVVLTLPLTDSTFNIIDAQAFSVMKPTAYLINVGRGELVDESALVQALEENRIAGAMLDVFVDEPLPDDSPLWEIPNVIISPHISGLSRHFEEDTVSLFVDNLNRFLADNPLYNQIDPERGY